jgi:hypothetical protein
MNPYLEQDGVWHDFHVCFMSAASASLVKQLHPTHIVQLKSRAYTYEVPGDGRDENVDVERLGFIEIRERESSTLRTVVELLSPCQKELGRARAQYVAARAALLAEGVEVVEIDLLRGGVSVPLERVEGNELSAVDYLITLSSPRGHIGVWPFRLREALPVCPVTVQPRDWATLDVKAILDRVYDEAGYEQYVYEHDPHPPLSPEDALWAAQFIGPFGRGAGPSLA